MSALAVKGVACLYQSLLNFRLVGENADVIRFSHEPISPVMDRQANNNNSCSASFCL